MAKRKEKRGRPAAYPGEGRAVRSAFSAPESLILRLEQASEQIGTSQSAIVVAGLRQILSQSPDRLREQIDQPQTSPV